MIRLCFLIRQFNQGGAQRQLIELVRGLNKSTYDVTVITFYEGGLFSKEIEQLDHVRYICLKKRGRWDIMGFLFRLLRQALRSKPDILHGYLGVANLLCVFLKPFLRKTRIVWGIRASYMDLDRYDWLTRLSFRLECFFSRFADLIIVNSRVGRNYHVGHGFPEERIFIISNGIDTQRFKPDPRAGAMVRAEWGLMNDEILIGLVGRLDPMKDHFTFLKAAALFAHELEGVRFVCVGGGSERYIRELRQLADQLGLSERVMWVGEREDMPAVYNALDIVTSSSYGEGFSNAIAEAMACGVSCVVTDAGDSAWVVGDTGIVVSPGNPRALTEGWKIILGRLEDSCGSLGDKARARIMLRFSRDTLVQKTDEALMSLL